MNPERKNENTHQNQPDSPKDPQGQKGSTKEIQSQKRSAKGSRNEILTVRQIMIIAVPCLLLYCGLGMPEFGHWVLNILGGEGVILFVGQYIWHFSMAFLFLFLIPSLLITKKLNIHLSSIGTQKGDWELGKKLLVLSLLAIPILYFGSDDPALINEYPLTKVILNSWSLFFLYELLYGVLYYLSYEFFFRGLMQLGLNRHWSKWRAIIFVSVITTLIHWFPMHKPVSEIIAAFMVGIVFGHFAEKTQSWYYIFAIHYLIGILNDIYCGLRFLGKL